MHKVFHLYGRWLTGKLKIEDMAFWNYGTFTGVMTKDTQDILTEIYNFRGFAQFLPCDIIEDIKGGGKGDVKVILDDVKTKDVEVTLEELEQTLEQYKEELASLKKKMTDKSQKNKNREDDSAILERIDELEEKIEKLKKIIDDCKKKGKNSYAFKVPLLGYYKRRPKPEIHLMMGTIGNDYELAAIVLIHEMMHAYFDKQYPYFEHPHCSEIEEPLAEYGMICFIEMFERFYPLYAGILDKAKDHVKRKGHNLGTCHYGFGYYLYEDKTYYCVDWVTLYHQVCTRIDCNYEDVKEYKSQISPVKYPQNQHACEELLYKILQPKRFYFKTQCSWMTKKRICFQAKHLRNNMEIHLKYPEPTCISIKIETKKGVFIEGEASIYRDDSRIFLIGQLKKNFESIYTRPNCYSFEIHESTPAILGKNAVWFAKEL